MIAISSHCPKEFDPEYFERQRLARLSWHGLFQKVIYLGNRECDLELPGTVFRPSEQFPTIQTLAAVAGEFPFATLLNADIILDGRIKLKVFARVEEGKYDWASSRRWEIPWDDRTVLERMEIARVGGRGRDIWVATRAIWQAVAGLVPPESRIGHQQCDAYLLQAFNSLPARGFDFTFMRLVYHPQHTLAIRPDPVTSDDEDLERHHGRPATAKRSGANSRNLRLAGTRPAAALGTEPGP